MIDFSPRAEVARRRGMRPLFVAQQLSLMLLLAATIATKPVPPSSCSLETVRRPSDPIEMPAVFYADQNCPSSDDLVDDSAIWQAHAAPDAIARLNLTAAVDRFTHIANKSIGRLARPSGLVVAGGDLTWLEQEAGVLRQCQVFVSGPPGCIDEPATLLAGLNCPQDFVIDFIHNLYVPTLTPTAVPSPLVVRNPPYARPPCNLAHAICTSRVRSIYVLQFGGGGGPEASLSCGGDGRITRFPLQAAADNSSLPVDVVNALVAPRFLALDPLFVPPLLFWTDPGFEGGSVMRANADGTNAHQLFHLAEPSGIAVDDRRQALYATQQVRGASLVWSSYDGAWQKHLTRETLYEPRGLAVDPVDGSVAIVEFDTFARGCDPLAGGGYGSLSCAQRNLGRISRVSCAWTADTTIDAQPPAPFQCCCYDPGLEGDNHWGCTLECLPPGPPPGPSEPPMPPTLPPLPPGAERVNVTIPLAPTPVRDYARMVVPNETLLFVGSYVTRGTQAISWGDPTTIALVSAARVAPPAPPGEVVKASAGTLYYGNCTPGCGRPTGADGCNPCPGGSYGLGDGRCRFCRPGERGDVNSSYAANHGQACMACPPGSYNPQYGATGCLPCPRGTFCADGFGLNPWGQLQAVPLTGGIALPIHCPIGTYNPLESSGVPGACLACPPGTANNQIGGASLDACSTCQPGYASPAGSSYCSICQPGTAQPLARQGACGICEPGTFANEQGMRNCIVCPLGSFDNLPGGTDPNCRACLPGTFADTNGSVSCAPCPNGTASAALRAESNATCEQCIGATFSLAPGMPACTDCPNGTEGTTLTGMTFTMSSNSIAGGLLPEMELPDFIIELCESEMDSPASRSATHGGTVALVATAVGVVAMAVGLSHGHGRHDTSNPHGHGSSTWDGYT